MSEEEKILKTIRYCANDYMKQEDGIQCFEWGDLWILNEYIKKLQQENQQLKEENERYRKLGFKYLNEQNNQLKEVIEEVREVINSYIPNEKAMCKALDEIEFILDKAKENK